MRPRVSVLLPVRDARETLEPCLRSLLRQTEPDWECVLVDDGSTDGSFGEARRIVEGDPRFRLVRTARRGIVPALQRGLEHVCGEWVARMDADDLAHRRRLELQLAFVERHRDLAAVGSHVRFFPRKGLGPGLREYERWLRSIATPEDVRREAFVECPVPHPTLFVRADVLREFGYRDCGWPEDYDLVLRLLEAGLRIGVVPRRLLAWRHHEKRTSLHEATYDVRRFVECKAYFLARGFLSRTSRYILCGHGSTGKSLRKALRRYGKEAAYILDLHPRRIGKTVDGAPVVPPTTLDSLPALPIVVSVARSGPRAEARAWLEKSGRTELVHFVCAA
ncbi:MAG: glycosyl transferase [Candidatus Binatia bacterium]|nr:MAG: glycosyl transferase [Candidatus Binatia bacterium]